MRSVVLRVDFFPKITRILNEHSAPSTWFLLFGDRFCRTDFVVQRPRLKGTDVALRDAETSVNKHHSVTIYIQQSPVKCKL